MAALYGQNKLGVVSNVGPLVEPVTQANIDDKQTPYSLFSHSDQIDCWQTGRADQRIATGLGRPRRRRDPRLQRRLGLPDGHVDLRRLDVLRGDRASGRSRSTPARSTRCWS